MVISIINEEVKNYVCALMQFPAMFLLIHFLHYYFTYICVCVCVCLSMFQV